MTNDVLNVKTRRSRRYRRLNWLLIFGTLSQNSCVRRRRRWESIVQSWLFANEVLHRSFFSRFSFSTSPTQIFLTLFASLPLSPSLTPHTPSFFLSFPVAASRSLLHSSPSPSEATPLDPCPPAEAHCSRVIQQSSTLFTWAATWEKKLTSPQGCSLLRNVVLLEGVLFSFQKGKEHLC